MELYFKHIRMHIRSAFQYRASFFLTLVVQILTPLTSCAGIYFLFDRFGSVGGYTFDQVLLCFGVTYCAYALAESFARGYDAFARQIRNGTFDRLLVLCSAFELNRVGKLVFAALLLTYGALHSGIAWTFGKVLTLLGMVAGGAFVFTGIWMAFAALCFITVEGIEVTNIFTDGGRELSSYPLDIYTRPIQKFFTFVVPFGVMNYVPLRFLLGYSSWLCALAPLYGVVFMLIGQAIFLMGVKRYSSTGS